MQEWNENALVGSVQDWKQLSDVQEWEKSIEIYNIRIKNDPKNVSLQAFKAQALVIKGRLEEAQQCWLEWLKNNSDSEDQKSFYQEKCQFLMILQWDEQLLEIIEKGIQNSSDKIFYIEKIGNYLQNNKKFKEAVKCWKEGIKIDPKNFLFYAKLGLNFQTLSNSTCLRKIRKVERNN